MACSYILPQLCPGSQAHYKLLSGTYEVFDLYTFPRDVRYDVHALFTCPNPPTGMI